MDVVDLSTEVHNVHSVHFVHKLLGERVSGTVIAGGVLVLVSVLIAQYAPERVRTSVPLEET